MIKKCILFVSMIIVSTIGAMEEDTKEPEKPIIKRDPSPSNKRTRSDSGNLSKEELGQFYKMATNPKHGTEDQGNYLSNCSSQKNINVFKDKQFSLYINNILLNNKQLHQAFGSLQFTIKKTYTYDRSSKKIFTQENIIDVNDILEASKEIVKEETKEQNFEEFKKTKLSFWQRNMKVTVFSSLLLGVGLKIGLDWTARTLLPKTIDKLLKALGD